MEPWLWERSGDGLRTYAALAGVLALGSIPALRSQKLADLPYFISLAVITIYVGADRYSFGGHAALEIDNSMFTHPVSLHAVYTLTVLPHTRQSPRTGEEGSAIDIAEGGESPMSGCCNQC